jgi:hypothetical protein
MTGMCGSRSFCVDVLTFSVERCGVLHTDLLRRKQKAPDEILGRCHPFMPLLQEVPCPTSLARRPLNHRASAIPQFHVWPIFPDNEQTIERNAVVFTSGNSHGRHERDPTAKIAEPSILHQFFNYKSPTSTPTPLQIWTICGAPTGSYTVV